MFSVGCIVLAIVLAFAFDAVVMEFLTLPRYGMIVSSMTVDLFLRERDAMLPLLDRSILTA